jgi:hypothetical protein
MELDARVCAACRATIHGACAAPPAPPLVFTLTCPQCCRVCPACSCARRLPRRPTALAAYTVCHARRPRLGVPLLTRFDASMLRRTALLSALRNMLQSVLGRRIWGVAFPTGWSEQAPGSAAVDAGEFPSRSVLTSACLSRRTTYAAPAAAACTRRRTASTCAAAPSPTRPTRSRDLRSPS